MAPRTEDKKPSRLSQFIPGSTGGVYTLIPGNVLIGAVVFIYVHSYLACQGAQGCVPVTPPMTGELLTAALVMLGLHTGRATMADKRNADNGVLPVPYEGDAVAEPDPAGTMSADTPYDEPPLPPDPGPYVPVPLPAAPLPLLSVAQPKSPERKRIPAI